MAISSRTKTLFVAGCLRDSSPKDSEVDQLGVLRLGVSSLPPTIEIQTISGKPVPKNCLENGSSWFSRQDSRGDRISVRSLAVNRRNDTLCICSSEGQVITFSRDGVIGKIPAGDGGSEESSLDGLSAIPPVSLTTLHEAGWGNDAVCVTTLRGDLGVVDPGGDEEGYWEMFHPGVLMASGEGREGRFMLVVDMIRWLEMAGNEASEIGGKSVDGVRGVGGAEVRRMYFPRGVWCCVIVGAEIPVGHGCVVGAFHGVESRYKARWRSVLRQQGWLEGR